MLIFLFENCNVLIMSIDFKLALRAFPWRTLGKSPWNEVVSTSAPQICTQLGIENSFLESWTIIFNVLKISILTTRDAQSQNNNNNDNNDNNDFDPAFPQ